MLSRIQGCPPGADDRSEMVEQDDCPEVSVSSGAAFKCRTKLVNVGTCEDTAADISAGSKHCALSTHSQHRERRSFTEMGTEDRVLEVQMMQPVQPYPPEYEPPHPQDAMLLKAPVVWSPCAVKAAVSRLSGIQPTLPTQCNPPVSKAVPPVNYSVMKLKAAVKWSPSTVQAAVNRLAEQPLQPTKPNPPVPEAFPPKDDSLMLPKATVAWSPFTVKAAVSRLTGVQHAHLTQPSRPATVDKEAEKIKLVQIGSPRSRVLRGPWKKIGALMLRGKFTRLPKAMMAVPDLRDDLIFEVLKLMDKECKRLSSLRFNSKLRLKDPVALKDFSWKNVMDEWKTTSPIFLKFLQHASKVFEKSTANQKPMPQAKSLTMAMGGALLLRSRSASMCAPMYINSMILRKGGAKKRCIEKLNRFGFCMSNHRVLQSLKGRSKTWDSKLAQQKGLVQKRSTAKHDAAIEKADMT